MGEVYNIYCDESCHLENDGQSVMVLGALWCPLDKRRQIADRIREIKIARAVKPWFDVKWTKVSNSKISLYIDLVNYFFDDDDLHFRALVVPDKTKLRHEHFGQTHDVWYYKMYFELLSKLLNPKSHYRIYLDVKDTRGSTKVQKLRDVLSNNMFDFSRRIIESVTEVRSQDVQQIQLADLLTGAVSYANRGLATSEAKMAIVERIRKRSGYSIVRTTLLKEEKINIFRWEASEVYE